MGRVLASIGTLGILVGTPLFAELVALPDPGWKAAQIFKETCLATRGQGIEAAVAAILARPGVKEGQSLPAYGSGKPMRTFVDNEKREYLIRPGKKGRYGCFVLLETSGDTSNAQFSQSAKSALDRTQGLRPKPSKKKQITYYEWSIDGSKDDIRLTPESDVGGILINLEVN